MKEPEQCDFFPDGTDQKDPSSPEISDIHRLSLVQRVASLMAARQYGAIGDLLQNRAISLDMIQHIFHEIDDDHVLVQFLPYSTDANQALNIIKHIADPVLLQDLIERNGHFPPSLIQEIVSGASLQLNALTHNPHIIPLSQLSFCEDEFSDFADNLFLMGISLDTSSLLIAWSNTHENSTHRGIFTRLSSNSIHPPFLLSGGIIDVHERQSGDLDVHFYDNSGTYGKFPSRVLRRFEKDLREGLQKQFVGAHILLSIQ